MPYPQLDPKLVKQLSLAERRDKMTFQKIRYLSDIVPSIGNHEVERDIDELAKKIVRAHQNRRPVIWMTGDHVTIRRGNQRYLIDLMERKIVTHLAGNGAVPIHDFELALTGSTLEDVEHYLRYGQFGNWEEVGFCVNEAAKWAKELCWGFGETIGWMINKDRFCFKFPHKDISVFASAYRLRVPATVHVLFGADIVHQHPNMDGAALGDATYRDFLILAHALLDIDGGVFLNMGTAVHGPEVFLKAVSMAVNVLAQKDRRVTERLQKNLPPLESLTTAVFDVMDLGNWREEKTGIYDWQRDMRALDERQDGNFDTRYEFRPGKTVLTRSIAALASDGESFYIKGDCGLTIPNLYKKIIDKL